MAYEPNYHATKTERHYLDLLFEGAWKALARAAELPPGRPTWRETHEARADAFIDAAALFVYMNDFDPDKSLQRAPTRVRDWLARSGVRSWSERLAQLGEKEKPKA